MSDKKNYHYPGEQANVSWRRDLCIHIGECGRAKGELFVAGRKPWCQPDVTDNSDVQAVIERCPTGALAMTDSDGANPEVADAVNTVHVSYNGPLFVRGNLEIDQAPEDVPGLKYRAALCRCGQSANKPFCDNSHIQAGFSDFGAIGDTGDSDVESGGSLTIKAASNGPLLLKGNLSMSSGSGRTSWHGKQVALCRCGASANKPFCDGSHNDINFDGS